MVVLLWQGMDQKIRMRRQLRHVTILQDYHFSDTIGFSGGLMGFRW
jgi:hypothetical protein